MYKRIEHKSLFEMQITSFNSYTYSLSIDLAGHANHLFLQTALTF